MNFISNELTLIVEPNSSGHRLYYVRLLAERAVAKGARAVILTTPDTVESAEWRVHLGEHSFKTVLRNGEDFSLSGIARTSTELDAVSTVVPDAGDHLLPALARGWIGPGQLKLLFVSADAQPSRSLSWLRPVKTSVKRSLIWIAGCRRNIQTFAIRSALRPARGPLHWVADPVTLSCTADDVASVRSILEGSGPRCWVGVFGAITPRKNLPLVIEAIQGCPGIGLLIAGTIDPEVAKLVEPLLARLTATGGVVQYLKGPLTDSEFDSAIAAVDCAVIAHSNEGSSGVVLKAAAAGNRVVVSGAASLRRDAAYLGQQAIWSPLDARDLRQAILRSCRMRRPTQTPQQLNAESFLSALIP